MFTFEVSSDCNQSKIRPLPSHKINISQEGFPTCTYWYVKAQDSSRPFDEIKDSALVQKIHENGKSLKHAESTLIELGKDRGYRLERIDSTEFTIKTLK